MKLDISYNPELQRLHITFYEQISKDVDKIFKAFTFDYVNRTSALEMIAFINKYDSRIGFKHNVRRSKMIKIDKNIPMPSLRGTPQKYPWNDMVPGDSFLINADALAVRKVKARLISAAVSRRLGHREERYAIREDVGGVRVWRVK